MFPLTLAMGASIAWGASDFLGGMVSRRLPVVLVLLGAQLVGLLLAALAWALVGAPWPNGGAIALGGAAGVAELLGFACLYRGLAAGRMSTVAPLSAMAAVLPVGVAVGSGAQVAALEAAGMGLAILGSAVTAADPDSRRLARGTGLGLGAALCFGAYFVFLGDASEQAGVAAVLCGRVVSVVLLVPLALARPSQTRPTRTDGGVILALGALDMAANLAYAAAVIDGADATVTVLASLYPLTTVILARALLHERLGAPRLAGAVTVLGGIALISASAGA
jgi:drug/metabolite transporter (DMT)-like permease